MVFRKVAFHGWKKLLMATNRSDKLIVICDVSDTYLVDVHNTQQASNINWIYAFASSNLLFNMYTVYFVLNQNKTLHLYRHTEFTSIISQCYAHDQI